MVKNSATDRFATEKTIKVTPEEIGEYRRALQRGMKQDRTEKEAYRDVLNQKLAADGIAKKDANVLRARLAEVEQFLKDTEPQASAQDDKAAMDEIASAFIRQWKVHKALHEQYGGRIGYQQGGPEPLDAVRKFLEERKEGGDFTIASKLMEESFWHYYRTDSLHQFYKSGSTEEAQAFAVAPWLVRTGNAK
jgi:hypothetical protein